MRRREYCDRCDRCHNIEMFTFIDRNLSRGENNSWRKFLRARNRARTGDVKVLGV